MLILFCIEFYLSKNKEGGKVKAFPPSLLKIDSYTDLNSVFGGPTFEIESCIAIPALILLHFNQSTIPRLPDLSAVIL